AEINPETAIDEIEASPEPDKISDDAILSGFNLDEVTINRMIMEARKLAGWLD
ncbi:MAG: hypothetical protein ACJA1M_000973, partial [Alphaproteobacteria bacterium]